MVVRAAEVEASQGVGNADARKPFAAPIEKIARLAVLHDEAAETARRARLLGRATYAALALGLSASVVAAHWDGELAPLLIWLILLGAGLVAVFRAYDSSLALPFELVQLRARSSDLLAVMLYFGFAWGAGSFLVAANTGVGERLVFSAGASIVVTGVLRSFAFSACFLLPTMVLATIAALAQPVEGRYLDALAILSAGVLVGLAGYALDRFAFARAKKM
jgi:hypothetical protein